MNSAELDEDVRKPSAAEEPRPQPNRLDGLLAGLTADLGSFVRQSPILALGGAFAVGYLVAKFARAVK